MISEVEDLILQQRPNNTYGFVFDSHPNIELLGYSKHPYKKYNVHYIKCFECAKDPELFGEAIFWATLSDMKKGQMPCGCARLVKWTKGQWETLANRASEDMGFTFHGWADDVFRGAITKCKMYCDKHGTWTSTTASNLIKLSRGCPRCGNEAKAIDRKPHKNAVTDEDFFLTGRYHPDTVFSRVGQREGKGAVYWSVDCPRCGIYGEAQADALKRGSYCCGCKNSGNQNQAYVNIIYDGDLPIALKFGITYNMVARIKEYKYSSIYKVENSHLFYFEDRNACRAAEKFCKSYFECGVVSKEDMPKGFSETTHLYNIDKILDIYRKYGGIEAPLFR